ncbi:putative bifunctional diguanylate cyclase/phosphodiesterase [Pseudorhizobium flavum]|uniref:Diguanylate cyclase (GGDEF)-like protein n=1 Tax=Pseudorhizobium flavum TaxID=1335061 RepID=A0A7W9Z369_9HYPH|nr:EAL domain-containing protein [Pseudorhizobium flavum]MBB6181721.1 diguanylate cyclase (GGDEF)-like protein [Pseudorhizobium flavum]CAD6616211.1 GGDEF-domain containing protein [Pseudorhizobium flavum]
MSEFLNSRAGTQFLYTCLAAIVLWGLAMVFMREIVDYLGTANGKGVAIALVMANVAGGVSIVYSLLRILDMKDEMLRRRDAERRADYIATHDHLTKLPNRYAFDRCELAPNMRLDDASEPATDAPFATVYAIDLDGFKKVNDLMGHQGGDVLLKEVARRICALAEQDCVFRFGGDEFIAIGRHFSEAKEKRFAELLIQSITRPVRIGSLTAEVGASIGYARLPEHGATLAEVSHVADIALYEAKGRGPNNHVLFEPEMQAKVSRRAKLEGELRGAIDKGSIGAFYQPLVDLRSGDVCGFEALARWKNEDGEFVPPNVFIPLAEEAGLITPLFQQLLRQACEAARSWPEGMGLSFNLSPVQMEDRMLPTRVIGILDEVGFPPERLELEITENALVSDPDLAAHIMDSLSSRGVQIALDDFGTGYSNLSQLARFRFDKIKIDKSFVAACGTDERQEKVIRAMLGLSRSLHAKTTVEGIEDHRQLAHFVSQGCDLGQGYLLGRPMPAEDVLMYLSDRRQVLATG